MQWLPPPPNPLLAAAEVHIWCVPLEVPPVSLQDLWSTLTADERSRAESFHFRLDRRRFIASRGLLRIILARYLRTAASRIRLVYGSHGKPELAAHAAYPLQFNASHAGGLALYAVTDHRAVGVDIEAIRTDLDLEAMAQVWFSPWELAEFRRVPPAERTTAFFNGWTRKEAFIKAVGTGVSFPLDRFDVSLRPGAPPALLRICGEERLAAPWRLTELHPEPGYAATLVVDGQDFSLKCWRWDDPGSDGCGRSYPLYFEL